MWIGFALDENIRGVILVHRWKSGKWRTKGFVKDHDVSEAAR
jgi:Na+-driven multidrug efflux pump